MGIRTASATMLFNVFSKSAMTPDARIAVSS